MITIDLLAMALAGLLALTVCYARYRFPTGRGRAQTGAQKPVG